MKVLSCGMNEAGGGDVVDLAGDTAGVIVDDCLGIRLKDFFRGA